ncbi:MAG: uridine kinase [Silvanigrellaceae bacterium]|nr:uridine kinase [Silvanigrellaceae bacterium]
MLNIKAIGISGGSGSGKTTVAKKIMQKAGLKNCAILSQDSYYFDQSSYFAGDGTINFDHPNAIDFKLLEYHLTMLKKGLDIHVPIYDFVTHRRKKETDHFACKKIILLDGTLILTQPGIRDLLDYSLFLEVSEDTRFQRRLKRDIEERGRTAEGVEKQFFSFVKPMHDEFVEPSKKFVTLLSKNEKNLEDCINKICFFCAD